MKLPLLCRFKGESLMHIIAVDAISGVGVGVYDATGTVVTVFLKEVVALKEKEYQEWKAENLPESKLIAYIKEQAEEARLDEREALTALNKHIRDHGIKACMELTDLNKSAARERGRYVALWDLVRKAAEL